MDDDKLDSPFGAIRTKLFFNPLKFGAFPGTRWVEQGGIQQLGVRSAELHPILNSNESGSADKWLSLLLTPASCWNTRRTKTVFLEMLSLYQLLQEHFIRGSLEVYIPEFIFSHMLRTPVCLML